MKSLLLLLTVVSITTLAQPFTAAEIAKWQQQAKQITIVRDTWGVPHIYGKTDADAVFGAIYAQCEDDFDRVETNYITSIGRLAEVEGQSALYQDLRARLFLDINQAKVLYQKTPDWMKKLLVAFADAANFYLYTHPQVKPKLITRFEPWMPLTFSEGSIGGNISAVSAERIKDFYEQQKLGKVSEYYDKTINNKNSPPAPPLRRGELSKSSFSQPRQLLDFEREPTGSNGFAIAPSKSITKNALLLINPHTSFYFRCELQMSSQEGLNAYGASTWGQFFIYQGFNENCGWMHTSSQADSMDEYLETVEKRNGKWYYKHGSAWKPVIQKKITLRYKENDKTLTKTFTTYYTHHGPVAGMIDGKWLTVSMMNDPINALAQSYLRTKATDYDSYKKVMQLNGNASNNTVFADRKGNIAYWHGNFMPRRHTNFDWSMPVDGSNPATDWQGLHQIDDIVHSKNPTSGWIQNCNATPFTVAGSSSPMATNYPHYMAPDPENYRGINAVRVLSRKSIFDLDTLIAAANDPYLSAFDKLIPALVATENEATSTYTKEAIQLLRDWNQHYGTTSIPTTLAIYWGEKIQRLARSRVPADKRLDFLGFTDFVIAYTTPQEKIKALEEVLEELTRDFGTWRIAWGEVNRFQRLTGKIQETYDDTQPSIAVGFTPSAWGSLAAYGARSFSNTKKRYGTVGNSFVAVVEFGEKVKARSVVTGGQSSVPTSPHFTDQAALFCNGQFKEVWFYPEDVKKHVEKNYKPGK